MKKIIIAISALLLSATAFAQQSGQLDSLFYIFPEFVDGTVMFADKTFSRGKLNINLYEQSLQCIDNGDTLQVAASSGVVSVTAKRRSFYWVKDRFIELMEFKGDYGLGISRVTSYANNVKEAGYGMTSSTSGTSTYARNDAGHMEMNVALKNRDNISYKVTPYFYASGKFVPASKKAFQKAFPDKKDFIETFVIEHNTRYTVFEDVKALYDAVK